MRIHPVCNAFLLKPFKPRPGYPGVHAPALSANDSKEYKVNALLGKRTARSGPQYPVQWKALLASCGNLFSRYAVALSLSVHACISQLHGPQMHALPVAERIQSSS